MIIVVLLGTLLFRQAITRTMQCARSTTRRLHTQVSRRASSKEQQYTTWNKEDPSPIAFSHTRAAVSSIEDTVSSGKQASPTTLLTIATLGTLLCGALIYKMVTTPKDEALKHFEGAFIAPPVEEQQDQQEQQD
eukprot:m.27045 g.27045  ORF g.27045 m.27045 type:complete len:134 (-) comp8894_c0_seq2:1368-1769(-)